MATEDHPEFTHVPVMLAEVLEWLAPVAGGVFVDATLGGAGHTIAALEAFPHLRAIGLDRDALAVRVSTERLRRFADRSTVVHTRYDHIDAAVRSVAESRPEWFSGRAETGSSRPKEGPSSGAVPTTTGTAPETPLVSAVLFDLGVSSAQFDLPERGFSYRTDAPLDMRMDQSTGRTAADICNEATEAELSGILHRNGDERFARRIAKAILSNRPIRTTLQLSAIVTEAIPAATRRTGGHPAKRTFQALRMEVNEELTVLGDALDRALDVLAPGGRCIVLSYHSGEDRIVKDRFRLAETGGCSCPPGLPCVCGALPRGRMVRRGVTRPQAAELAANPRAASCVARVFELTGSVTGSSTVTEPGTGLGRSTTQEPDRSRRNS